MEHVFFKETAVHETKEILYRTLLCIMSTIEFMNSEEQLQPYYCFPYTEISSICLESYSANTSAALRPWQSCWLNSRTVFHTLK